MSACLKFLILSEFPIDELKENIDQRFEAQSEMIRSVVHDVCALLIENFKIIFKEEIKKEIDEK